MGNYIEHHEMISFFNKFKPLPMVSFGMRIENIPSIIVENKNGMRQLVDHFIENHGYSKIAFIRGPENHPEAQLRFEAYRESLAAHNISYNPNIVKLGTFVEISAIEITRHLITKQKGEFDAIIAANDDMLLGVLKVLQEAGFRIPEDIGIAGFDDIEDTRFTFPQLTSVKQPFYKQGSISTKFILDIIKGKEVPDIFSLPSEIVIRQSCGCLNSHYQEPFKSEIKSTKKAGNIEKLLKDIKYQIINTILNKVEFSKKFNKNILMNWIKKLLVPTPHDSKFI